MNSTQHLRGAFVGRRLGRAAALAGLTLILVASSPAFALSTSHHAGAPAATTGYGSFPTTVPAALHAPISSSVQHAGLNFLAGHGIGHPFQLSSTPTLRSIQGPARTGTVDRPNPASGNTASNFYINGAECAFDERATQIGTSPDALASLLLSSYALYNGSTGTTPCNANSGLAIDPFFYSHGILEVAKSLDSGRSWTDSWPATATTWYGLGVLNNTLWDGFGGIAADHGASVATSTVLVTGDYAGTCGVILNLLGGFLTGCTSGNVLNNSYSGIAIGRSTDGATSWSNATVLSKIHEFNYVSASGCSGFAQENVTEEPSIALNPVNNHAIATWDVFDQGVDLTQCIYVPQTVETWRSISIDGGANWGTPKMIASMSAGQSVVSAIGPAPTYQMSTVWNDYTNGNATQTTHSIGFSRSVDNGTTWSAPKLISNNGVNNIPGTAAGTSLRFFPYPVIAADNWSNSAHAGNIYVAWGDNETGTNSGYAGINVVVSSNGGTSFSSPATIVDKGHSVTYWNPAITVSSGGTVWLSFIGVGVNTGLYREYGAVSTDGGVTWSAVFVIDDSPSIPGASAPALGNILYNYGLVGTSNGTYAAWSDCRMANCTSTFDLEAYIAQVYAASLSTDAPALNLSVTTFGTTTTVPITNVTASTTGWPSGSTHTVVAPLYIPYPPQAGYIDAFQSYSGLVTSTNPSITFTTTAGGTLMASYLPVQAAIIAGTFSPNVPQAQLVITPPGGVPATVPLTPLNATTLQFSYTVPGGGYNYTASAGVKYVAVGSTPVLATSGSTTTLNIVLPKTPGWITGSLSLPSGATVAGTTVTVNGTPISVSPTTGLFNVTVPWGYYWVNATNPQTTSYLSTAPIVVNPNTPTPIPIALNGGWIDGFVKAVPSKLNGLVITVDDSTNGVYINGGTFNWTGLGGWHWLNATIPGYNATSILVNVTPGVSSHRNIDLSNAAIIAGQIDPLDVVTKLKTTGLNVQFLNTTNALVYSVASFDAATGLFNLSVRGGVDYKVTVTAKGYQKLTTVQPAIPAGQTSALLILTLTPNTPANNSTDCHTNNSCPVEVSNNNPAPPWTLIIAAIIVLLLVAAVAIALLMRRRRADADAEMAPEDADSANSGTYADTPTSDIPKMQSDWNEGPGTPPR
jgi:hypothetical protein